MKKFDFSHVLSQIQPSEEEINDEILVANKIVSIINSSLYDLGFVGCIAVLTGSVAKRTFLRNKKDIDVFVLFPSSTPKENLKSIITNIFLHSFPGVPHQLSYAEHPYVRFHFDGRRVDLVPAYKIENSTERLSAVDRSVLHTKFVNSSLPSGSIKEVLLLKAFLKSNSLYGAEIKIQGFSGYLCELLIIQFGSFTNLMKSASKWKASSSILFDLNKVYISKSSQAQVHKKLGNFVFVDPTDPERNVAAAVSADSLVSFIDLSKKFLKSPNENMFLKPPESFDSKLLKLSKSGSVYLISLPKPSDVVDDVIWGQIRKFFGQLKRAMEEFEPVSIIADDTRHLISIAICIKKEHLAKTMEVRGPPASMKNNVENFKKVHKSSKFKIKKGFVYALSVKRKFVEPISSIRAFFAQYRKNQSHLAVADELLIVERLPPYKKQKSAASKKIKGKIRKTSKNKRRK